MINLRVKCCCFYSVKPHSLPLSICSSLLPAVSFSKLFFFSLLHALAEPFLNVKDKTLERCRHHSPSVLPHLNQLKIGGHTAEMINVLNVLQSDRFWPRFYIAAATDHTSLQKAGLLEGDNNVNGSKGVSAQFLQIYRIIRIRPHVVLCNGPGTCVPLCVIAFLFKVVGIRWSSVFYVESIARVRKLSLSGLLLYKLRIADQFFVQWPQLQIKYQRAHYVGRLM